MEEIIGGILAARLIRTLGNLMLRNLMLVERVLVAVWLLISIILESVLQKAGASWPEDDAVEEKWKVIIITLTSAADDVLGTSSHRQPVTLSLDYNHCLTAGIGITIDGFRQVRQRILFFFEELGEILEGQLKW